MLKMPQVAVYRYSALDRDTGRDVAAARMGTREAIRRAKGVADLESKELVDLSEVDCEGFYPIVRSLASASP
jgi:hypothetical protein